MTCRGLGIGGMGIEGGEEVGGISEENRSSGSGTVGDCRIVDRVGGVARGRSRGRGRVRDQGRGNEILVGVGIAPRRDHDQGRAQDQGHHVVPAPAPDRRIPALVLAHLPSSLVLPHLLESRILPRRLLVRSLPSNRIRYPSSAQRSEITPAIQAKSSKSQPRQHQSHLLRLSFPSSERVRIRLRIRAKRIRNQPAIWRRGYKLNSFENIGRNSLLCLPLLRNRPAPSCRRQTEERRTERR